MGTPTEISEGKGKGGPKEGCWTCGGNHYQSDCPQSSQKGKGKGRSKGKGLGWLGEWQQEEEQQDWHEDGALKYLSSLRAVQKPPVSLGNYWQSLGDGGP